jgi:hypothetical protein
VWRVGPELTILVESLDGMVVMSVEKIDSDIEAETALVKLAVCHGVEAPEGVGGAETPTGLPGAITHRDDVLRG